MVITSCLKKHRPKWHGEHFKELCFLAKDQFSFVLSYSNYIWDDLVMNGNEGVHYPFSGEHRGFSNIVFQI